MHKTENASLRQMEREMERCRAHNDRTGAVELAGQIKALFPRNRTVWEKLIVVFIDGGQIEEAITALTFMEAHFKPHGFWQVLRAWIAYMRGDYQTVLDCGEQALQDTSLQPWQKAWLYNVLAIVEIEIGRADKAAAYELASSKLPNNPLALLEYSNMLFYLHYLEIPQAEIYKALCGYNELLSRIKPYTYNAPYNHKKIRVGYVSADFRYSVVALFTFVLFSAYDKSRFEVYVYAKGAEDGISRMIAEKADVWRNISKLLAVEAAKKIHSDEIDILFDPSGHTANNCLEIMAYKPAPIQMCGIGWFDSTGMKTIDYFLTDVYVDPYGSNDEYFTEKLLRLPYSHFCYYLTMTQTQTLPAPFPANGYITFGTLNKFAKITDKMLGAWAEILRKVPQSRLFLKGKTFDTVLGRETAYNRLKAAGIDEKRVIWEGFSSDYMSAYGKIDIALDTFPYPGGTTTCDALFAGVPVVTLVGHTHNSRFGYSLLKNLQLEELCAQTLSEYIAICTELAGDRKRLLDYRQTLPQRFRQSPLMDEGGYMMELELRYEALVPRNDSVLSDMETLAQCEERKDWDRIILLANARLAAHEYSKEEEALLWGWLGEAYLGSTKNTSFSRAKYCLQKALSKVQGKQRLIFLYYLCETAEKLGDFDLQYRTAQEAATMLNQYGHDLPKCWISNLNVICAHTDMKARKNMIMQAYQALKHGDYVRAEQIYLTEGQTAESLSDRLGALSSYLLTSQYSDYDTAEICRRQELYARALEQIKPLPITGKPKRRESKLRIGYVSPDFRNHALFPIYYGLFACFDRARFHVIGYQLNARTDAFTKELRKLASEWRRVAGLSAEDIARLMRNDDLDILVDLAGHSAGSGLPVLAYRPAPVQISGLGSLCTTGVKVVDYFITDEICDPPGLRDDYYKEKLLYMPCLFSYAGRNDVPSSSISPFRKNGFVQLGCFQEYTKINDETLTIWREILCLLPEARLLFKSIPFELPDIKKDAFERMSKAGLPMERVILEAGDENYMQRMLDVDLMLDTYPYTGGRTTLDSLYMGVPVVTRYGERRNTRFGYSILHSLGLEELAVSDKESYVERVVSLANNGELLDILHKNMRQIMNKSTALSPRNYTQILEKNYLRLAKKKVWLLS